MDDEINAVVITPEAWGELYAVIKPFIKGLAEWGAKFEQPMPVAVGVAVGVGGIIGESGDVCTCPICEEITDRIAEELMDRMAGAINAVRH